MRVLVVGAGIGGLGAAIAFAQREVDVDLVEVKPAFSVYGVGINQPANSLRALKALGILDACLTVGYQFDKADFYAADGEHLTTVPYGFTTTDVPCNNALARVDLHNALIARAEELGIKIQYGTTVETSTDRGDGVDVLLTDGRRELYDLVVGACRGAGFEPRAGQEAAHMQTVVGLVAAGAGVSLVPASVAGRGEDGVAYRPLRDETPPARIAVALRLGNPSHTVGAFLRVVDEVRARGRPSEEPGPQARHEVRE
jgi:glycine/D-amino acid oxidase-like deaminating enzyme